MEEYVPSLSPLAALYSVQPGDVGMHLLVAPPAGPARSGYTAAVMDAVLERLFAAPDVERIVVEPDARNTKIQALNTRLGFEPAGIVHSPTSRRCSASAPGKPSTPPAPRFTHPRSTREHSYDHC